MPYHWKNFITASWRMARGISTMASRISRSVASGERDCARMAAFCAGGSGSSGTRKIDQTMVDSDSKAPMTKATIVICGMWLSPTTSLFMPAHTRIDGARYDSVCARPVKALCVR